MGMGTSGGRGRKFEEPTWGSGSNEGKELPRDEWDRELEDDIRLGLEMVLSSGIAILGFGGAGRRRDASWSFGSRGGVGVGLREDKWGGKSASSVVVGDGGPV